MKQKEEKKGDEEEPREFDILGAVRALEEKKPLAVAASSSRLSEAQIADLREHVAAWARIRRGEMPALTPFERHSVYGDNFDSSPPVILCRRHPASDDRRRTIYVTIVRYGDYAACCSA
jgi:hypothetical protein